MPQQIIEFQKAESDLLACATYFAQKIGSSDGHAETIKELAPFYLERNDVDTAAQLADSVDDSFSRDKILVDVAEKCAEIGDDEYALQLADAIDDSGLQSMAIERIAVQKAMQNEVQKAFEYIGSLEHTADAMASIAVNQFLHGDETGAGKTISGIDVPLSKASSQIEIASVNIHRGEMKTAVKYLEQALASVDEIDFPEEKLRCLLQISNHFIDAERKDRAIESLDAARSIAEVLPGISRENILANISVGFLRAGTIELADRTLDLVSNKTLLASALTSFAVEFQTTEGVDVAVETLEEAYSILKSEPEKAVRDSRARFSIMGAIAATFGSFGQFERAIEVALENPFGDERIGALKKIAQLSSAGGNEAAARHAIEFIDEPSERIFALIGVSDAVPGDDAKMKPLEFLNEALNEIEHVPQPFQRTVCCNWLIVKLHKLGEKAKARAIAAESLVTASKILDEGQRSVAIAHIAKIYDDLGFELDTNEKATLSKMLRKAEW